MYFGKKADGTVADIDQMTYAEVVCRMVELMYVQKHKKWIDFTYRIGVFDMLTRAVERLAGKNVIKVCVNVSAEALFFTYWNIFFNLALLCIEGIYVKKTPSAKHIGS